MSTNFYGYSEDHDYHLGASAGGWEFMFQALHDWDVESPVKPVGSFGAWFRNLFIYDGIVDEYGREYTPDELLERIESRDHRYSPVAHVTLMRDGAGSPGLRDFRHADCCFSYSDFS